LIPADDGHWMTMQRYDGIWRTAVGVLAAIGVLAALLLVPLGPILAAFAFVAFLAAASSVSFGLSADLPPAQVFRAAPRWATLGGGAAVATLGYGVAAGAEVLLLLLVVAGSAPPVGRWLGWLPSTAARPTAAKLTAAKPAGGKSSPRKPARIKPILLDVVLPELKPEDQLSQLTAAELCMAWRRSFTELRRSDHWSATIDVRRAYLDELERRYPEQFAAWLASGPRAASDPGRFFNHSDA
jgi:hypothetical protein